MLPVPPTSPPSLNLTQSADDIPPARNNHITNHRRDDAAAVIKHRQPLFPVPDEQEVTNTPPAHARFAITPRPESPSYMLHTHSSATKTGNALDSPGRRCARRRSRRMASVAGQTALLRLRTSGAATLTPSEATTDVAAGKENAGRTPGQKRRPAATPLRARAAAPLRLLDDYPPASPTPPARRCSRANGLSSTPQTNTKDLPDPFAAGNPSSPSRKRKAATEHASPDSPSKRAKRHDSPRRRNVYAAAPGRDGSFRLTRPPRVGTPERRVPHLASPGRRRAARTASSTSAVGALPAFPAGYFFGALEGAVEGLVPFMGVGGRRAPASTEASGTVVRRLVSDQSEGSAEDEGEGDINDEDGSVAVKELVERSSSSREQLGRRGFF